MDAHTPAIIVIGHRDSDMTSILQRIVRDSSTPVEIVTVRDMPHVLTEIAERLVPLLIVDDRVPTDVVLLFAQELRALSPQTRIVQTLSERTEDVERRAAAAGASLLPNPFPYAALERLVRDALEP